MNEMRGGILNDGTDGSRYCWYIYFKQEMIDLSLLTSGQIFEFDHHFCGSQVFLFQHIWII
jgi:hypothetical protein